MRNGTLLLVTPLAGTIHAPASMSLPGELGGRSLSAGLRRVCYIIPVFLLFCRVALATTIAADTGGAAVVLGVPSGLATLSLSAFSEQTAPAPVGPNRIPTDDRGAGGIAAPIPGGTISIAPSATTQRAIFAYYMTLLG